MSIEPSERRENEGLSRNKARWPVPEARRHSRSLVGSLVALPLLVGSLLAVGGASTAGRATAADVPVDLSSVSPESPITFDEQPGRLVVRWPLEDSSERGRVEIALDPSRPRLRALGIDSTGGDSVDIARDVEPVFSITVGERDASKGWGTFFDKVHRRPYERHGATLETSRVTAQSEGDRVRVELATLEADSFHGTVSLVVFPGSPAFLVETTATTDAPWRAILYDAGLVARGAPWRHTAWTSPGGDLHREVVDRRRPIGSVAIRHRAIVAEGERGSLAVFPPPHQFFDPLDNSYNLEFAWRGRGFATSRDPYGIGVRHDPRGDDRFVPWFNAPPGSVQRLRFLVQLERGPADRVLESVLRWTRGDRFARLPGHRTFTSHYHIEHAVDVIERRARGESTSETPEFVDVFREMGVEIVHLGEFHLAGHPRDPGPRRLAELELLHDECRRLSTNDFLLLPGEEPNVQFGGHWMSFFPKPIYWILGRRDGEPFTEDHPRYGTVYRVGSAGDVQRLLELEGGLAWTAHARIKSSRGYPDRYRNEEFFRSPHFLGAAWKAMPADLSKERLGERVLDLLDDMNRWSLGKYVIGEVDVFTVDRTHELYGPMNINYLRLEELPRFDDGWAPVLDALRKGAFFVTTGEILLEDVRVGGRQSGERLETEDLSSVALEATLQWTFPLEFAEWIVSDGETESRRRIDLRSTPPFGRRTIRQTVDLRGQRWVRFEVWDSVTNGAFSQPVWIGPEREGQP